MRTVHMFSALLLAAGQVSAVPQHEDVAPPAEPPALPADFDSRSLVFGCGDTIMDQHHCGSCWAFAATGSLTDRYCIWSGGRLFAHDSVDASSTLSPQPILNCGKRCGKHGCVLSKDSAACNGGMQPDAWRYYKEYGTLTCRRQPTQFGVTCDAGCAPYVSGSCAGGHGVNTGCYHCSRDMCADGGKNPVEWSPELWKNTSHDHKASGTNHFRHMIFKAAEVGAVGDPNATSSYTSAATLVAAAAKTSGSVASTFPEKKKPWQPDVNHIQREIMTNGPVDS